MKIKYFLTSLFFLAVTFFLSLNAVQAQNSTHGASFSYGENEISYKVSDLDLAKTPFWKPEQGEPPVSLQRALEIARANLPRFVKNADDFKVRHIILSPLGTDRWYYDFSFDCQGNECLKNSGRYFKVLVKMDGEIVEPKVTPLKDKEEKSR
ncbi:MAG: hypothetical protein ACR2MG_02345 [Pyrinomonadaceae bacterium]|jgi:hypothetical protein